MSVYVVNKGKQEKEKYMRFVQRHGENEDDKNPDFHNRLPKTK